MYQIMLVEDEALVRESMAQNTNWENSDSRPRMSLKTAGRRPTISRLFCRTW